ncbi:MAG: hypothetical protein AAF380_00055 [Bacteroidota bacterium]
MRLIPHHILIPLLLAYAFSCPIPSQSKTPTLYDMQNIPSDFECMLLAKHAYKRKIHEGEILQYEKGSFITKSENQKTKKSYLSYLSISLVCQILITTILLREFFYYVNQFKAQQAVAHPHIIMPIFNLPIIFTSLIGIIWVWSNDITYLLFHKKKTIPSLPIHSQDFKQFNDQKWQVVKVFKSKKFTEHQSVIYTNGAKSKIVMSVQGSTELRDWINTNWEIFRYQKVAGQVKLANELLEVLFATTKKIGHFSQITLTGHSLGGIIVESMLIASQMHHSEKNIHLRAICFETPGVKELLRKINFNTENNRIDLATLDITKYVSAPNLLNTTSDSIGTLRMTLSQSPIELGELVNFYVIGWKLLFYGLLVYLPGRLVCEKLISINYTFNQLTDVLSYLSPKLNQEEAEAYLLTSQFFIILTLCFLLLYIIPFTFFYYKFHRRWLPYLKDLFYSYYTHSINNLIKNTNPLLGTINSAEVAFFPKYGEKTQGPGDLFPELDDNKDTLAKNLIKSRMGFCYVKNQYSNNSKFIHMRNILPQVRLFLLQIDKKYTNPKMRNTVLQLLGLPINYVYDHKDVFKGIESTKQEIDVRIIVDRIISLLKKKKALQSSH